MTINKQTKPDKKLTAVCGLFCPSCTVHIGTKEDPARLALIAKHMGLSPEDTACDGCRGKNRFVQCAECKFIPCAESRGIDFCGECEEYPCEMLKTFQAEKPHRLELWDHHREIKESSWEKWYGTMTEHYSCPDCGVLNSAYDLVCRACGIAPGSAFAEKHGEAVKAHLQKTMKAASK